MSLSINLTATKEHSYPLYTLTFDSNGGSTCNPKTITKENGVEWGKLCVPTREGYTFVEWKDSNGNSVKNTTKAKRDLKIAEIVYYSIGGVALALGVLFSIFC